MGPNTWPQNYTPNTSSEDTWIHRDIYIYKIYVLESADAKTVVDLAADLIHVYLVIAIYNYCIVME
jgi:hypothetical protein